MVSSVLQIKQGIVGTALSNDERKRLSHSRLQGYDKAIRGLPMWIWMINWCALFLCVISFGTQNHVYELKVENQPDATVRIISALINSPTTDEIALYLKVENIGQLPVKEFSISMPGGGGYRFGYPLKPGETKEINVPLPGKTKDLIQRGELRLRTVGITRLEWAEDAGVAIPINLSTRVAPSLKVELSTPKEGIYFPQEPDTLVPLRAGMKVLSYARVKIKIHNISNKSFKEVWWKLKGAVAGRWEDIEEVGWAEGVPVPSEGGLLVIPPFSPGEKKSFEIRVPIEFVSDGVTKRFDKFRLVITKIDYLKD